MMPLWDIFCALCARLIQPGLSTGWKFALMPRLTAPMPPTSASRPIAAAISDYIVSETGIAPGLIGSHAEGIAWHELRRMVAADGAVPYQAEVLEVLDNTPVWVFDDAGAVVGGRKKALMDLRGGVPYRWLYEHVFPVLRNAVAVSLYLKSEAVVPEQPVAAADATAG